MSEPDSFPEVRKLLQGDVSSGVQAVGTTLGKYRLLREIARGGMAIVYEAEDPDLGRKVAIKVLRDVAVREVERLRREATLAARLAHPNIIAIHEVGVVTQGREDSPVHYIAMDFVEGGTLESLLKTATREEKLRLLETVAEAVGFAHAGGVTHRDIKPANILIAKDGHPVVTDFGLARSAADPTRLTASGTVLGTPHYMAPEQVSADLRAVGPASDVWALGVILYEILTRTDPFEGRSTPELFLRILSRDPVPPRRRSTGVSVDLETVCLMALEKDPRRRYPTARELAEDLRRCREGKPILAHPPSATYRARKWLRRHRTWIVAAVATFLFAIGGGWGLFRWSKEREFRDHRRRARAAFEARDWAKGLFEAGEAVKIRRDPEMDRMATGCAGRIAAQARIQPLRDLIRETRLCFYIKGEDIRKRLEQVEAALSEVEILVRDFPDFSEAGQVLGMGWYFVGHDVKAESCLERIPSDPWARFYLGKLYLERALAASLTTGESKERRRSRKKRWAEMAVAVLDGEGDLGEVERHVAQAFRAVAERDFERAERLCREGLERFRDAMGTEDYWILRAVMLLKGEASLQAYATALERRPHYPWAYFMRGSELLKIDSRLAIQDFDQAVRLNPRFADAYSNRGVARMELGEYAAAIDDYSEAVRLRPDSALYWYNRGDARLQIHEWDLANEDFEESLRLDPESWEAYHGRALARGKKRDFDGAESDLSEAIRLNPESAMSYLARGLLRKDRKDYAAAVEDLSRALSLAPPDWAVREKVQEYLDEARRLQDKK